MEYRFRSIAGKLKLSTKLIAAQWILPPGVTNIILKARKVLYFPKSQQAEIYNPLDQYRQEEWSLFLEALEPAKSYLEFGSGLSTEFASTISGLRVRTVDTSADWALRVQERVRADVEVIHVDLGPVGPWGRPVSYERRNFFGRYFEAGFDGGFDPDVVLIDGRFRVACFLSALLLSGPGTKIIFDDYSERPHYRVVEEVLQPKKTNSRQALFVRPELIDVMQVEALRNDFRNVLE